MELTLKATEVFYRNLNSKSPIVINRGGARSSKSYSLHQLFLTKFFNETNKEFLIVRKTLPSLRLSALAAWEKMLTATGVRSRVKENRQMLSFKHGSNCLHFGSVDDPEKIKSTEFNYIWMEEATEFDYKDFQQLRLRLSAKTDGINQIFLSFNPISEQHWVKQQVIDRLPGIDEIVSTYKNNPFLSAEYIALLEGLKDQDEGLYNVYALGLWGTLSGTIYTKWNLVNQFPAYVDEVIYGLDFGFNNPTALVKIGIKDTEIYEEEKLYQPELTNSDLINLLHDLIEDKDSPIYADCAEPQRIEEIARAGFNIHPADKVVKDGIDFVKRQRPQIVRGSDNLVKEKQGYSWRKDKSGKALDEPIKFNDHLMDAERYALYTHLKDSSTNMNIKQQSYLSEDNRVFAGAEAW